MHEGIKMTTEDAKGYLARREIPQLFEVNSVDEGNCMQKTHSVNLNFSADSDSRCQDRIKIKVNSKHYDHCLLRCLIA